MDHPPISKGPCDAPSDAAVAADPAAAVASLSVLGASVFAGPSARYVLLIRLPALSVSNPPLPHCVPDASCIDQSYVAAVAGLVKVKVYRPLLAGDSVAEVLVESVDPV
jgi:hypothetical protein